MATRKKPKKRAKPHYVRTKKRKGADSSTLFRRGITVALLVLILAVIVGGTIAGLNWIERNLFSENPRFEIQQLDISSDGRLSEDRIREYTKLAEGMNLFEVSFEEIQKRLEPVSYVEDVHLERQLPHTLIVRVKERVPVARITWKSDRNSRYPLGLDRNGYVLPRRKSTELLPLVKGLDAEVRAGEPADHPDVARSLDIIAKCNSSAYLRNYVRIESLDVQYSDYIDMRLSGEIRVRMPRYSTKAKLQMLATILKIEAGKGKRVREIDLTVDSSKVKVPISHY